MLAENTCLVHATWPALEGTLLPGGYELGETLEANSQKAKFRVRVLGGWSAPAHADLFCMDPAQAHERVALWHAAQDLKHPNVASPLSAGELQYQGTQLAYVIFPAPDEDLAAALRNRPLAVDESLDILKNVRLALQFLHAHGWVHRHLAPKHVLAIGDGIQVSMKYAGRIDTVYGESIVEAKYLAPESIRANVTPAADVWCLGATLFEGLTQQVYSADKFSQARELPRPFDRIVEHCLDPDPRTRATLNDLSDLAANRATTPPPPTLVAPTITTPVTAAPTAAQAPKPVERRNSAPVLARVPITPKRPLTQGRIWIYVAAAAFVVLLLMVWAGSPRRDSSTAATQASDQQPAVNGTIPDVSETRPVAPISAKPAAPPAPSPANSHPQEPATINGAVWRVVVFTYAHEPAAQNKARFINKRHPDLDATVFSPSGKSNMYLVVVGGKMTREDAARLRQHAIRMGLPRDSYIQNYKE